MESVKARKHEGTKADRVAARRRPLPAMLIVPALACLVGCRGELSDAPPRQFFPDMDDQPKYKAQGESHFFEDGRTMREPVRGTLAFGARSSLDSFEGVDFAHRAHYLKDSRRVFEGREAVIDAEGRPVLEADGSPREVYVERIPVDEILGLDASAPDYSQRKREGVARMLATGEKYFNIYCIVCHGGLGDGKGLVGVRWSYPLPTWHDPQYLPGGEKGQDGYIFHTIRNGVPNVGDNVPYPLKMPSYAGKLTEEETWAIVAYFRALQESQGATIDKVPERERLDLERRRGVQPQTTGGGPGKERGS